MRLKKIIKNNEKVIINKKIMKMNYRGKKIRKCSWCNKKATLQTVKGEANEKAKGLPQNDGWYCNECYKKGLDMEEEAMYGTT